VQGDFNPQWALPLTAKTIIGGNSRRKVCLKHQAYTPQTDIFAYTNWLAAIFMAINDRRHLKKTFSKEVIKESQRWKKIPKNLLKNIPYVKLYK